MPESIEQTFLLLDTLDELRDILLFADRLEHSQNSLIGPAVFRSIESASSTGHSGIHIDSR